jgi:hypothetical protein
MMDISRLPDKIRPCALLTQPGQAVAGPTDTATVVDAGTFTTVAGNSPGAGKPLAAGIKGLPAGGFTATPTE